MSGWAALAAGADYAGKFIMDERKTELAERLAKEAEDRAEQRQIAREERAATRETKKVASSDVVQKNGSYIRRNLNAEGDVLKEEPLNPYEIDKLTRENQKESASIEKLLAETAKAKAEAAALPEKYSQERRYNEARIESYNRRSARPLGGANSTKPESYSMPDKNSLEAMFPGEEDNSVSQEDMADFLLWRKNNPQFRDGDEALAAYVAEREGEAPDDGVHFIDPSKPGSMTIKPPSRGSSKVGNSPYAEGTRLRGKDGKIYVVKNGVPVAE